MKRALSLVLLFPVVSACMASVDSRPATGPQPRAPSALATPTPGPAPAPGVGYPPAGIYNVTQRVSVDTCHPTRNLPQQVTVLLTHDADGAPHASVPLPNLIDPRPASQRTEFDLRGHQASGMAHPKVCPGAQQTYREELLDVTPTGFRVSYEYEVADGWDCPNARPGPMCRTDVVYEYTLASAACDARCDGTVPGVPDREVAAVPTRLTCTCR